MCSKELVDTKGSIADLKPKSKINTQAIVIKKLSVTNLLETKALTKCSPVVHRPDEEKRVASCRAVLRQGQTYCGTRAQTHPQR